MPTIKPIKGGFHITHTTREVWGVDDPSEIEAATQPETASALETKSDPEIEARVKLALDYFWTSAAGTIEHHLTRPIPDDLAVRLEAAAYDAIEAWRAENGDWSGSPDPADPDNFWIDDETGERVNAHTGERTPPQPR